MKRFLLIIALVNLWSFAFAVETGFDEVGTSCSAVITTGACTTLNVHPPDYVHVPSVATFTWQVIISGGTATSVGVNLEGSLDQSSWTTLDSSTNNSGELRTISVAAVKYFRCNVTGYNRNGTSLSCQIMPTAATVGTGTGTGSGTVADGTNKTGNYGVYTGPTTIGPDSGMHLSGTTVVVDATNGLTVPGGITTGLTDPFDVGGKEDVALCPDPASVPPGSTYGRITLNSTTHKPSYCYATSAATFQGDLVSALSPVFTSPSLGTSYLSGTSTAGSTGTTANLLVKIDASGQVVNLAASDAVGLFGIAITTATSGNPVEVATRGRVDCVADNTTIVGNILVAGTSTAGRCRDSGQTSMTLIANNVNVVGKARTAVSAGSLVSVQLYGPGHYGAQPLTQYTILRCYPGQGDGLNAMAAGTYLQTNCYNNSGVTWTITRIGCFTDNSGTSTLNAANGAATGLLTGAVTCTTAAGGAAGTQSGTTTIANGDVIKFTFVADGTSKQTTWFVSLTQ